ncbi:hypothetical protein LZ30DRAFT_692067 [Colletotrichum cereale]|nr:hypothetical protein LZ30DRAFT_692067 [Colletotrichum cereale]
MCSDPTPAASAFTADMEEDGGFAVGASPGSAIQSSPSAEEGRPSREQTSNAKAGEPSSSADLFLVAGSSTGGSESALDCSLASGASPAAKRSYRELRMAGTSD